MATPAAILSILVKTQGAQAVAGELSGVDKSGRAAAGGMSKAEAQARKSGKAFSALGATAKGAGVLLGAAGLAKGIRSAFDEFQESVKVGAQTEAVLKSTGGAAKVTAKQIQDLAGSISKKTGIDDEQIQASENMLLTFTKVRNETGKGNKIFDQATQVVTDMSAALGQDGKSSAIQLGKALNDPIKGITALRRVGVSFDDQQKKQIETMVKSGDRLGAQKVILKELRNEFSGSAAAQATAADKFKVALSNVAEAAGAVLVPVLNKVMGFLTTFFSQMTEGVGVGGALISKFKDFGGALAPFGESIKQIVGWLQQNTGVAKALAIGLGILAGAIIAVNVAMSLNPFVAAGLAIAALVVGVVTAYREFDTFHKIVDTVVEAVKAAIPTLVDVFNAVFPVIVGIVKGAWNTIKAVTTAVWPTIKAVVSGALTAVRGVVQVFSGVIHGDFSKIWEGIKDIFRGVGSALAAILRGGLALVIAAGKALGKGVVDGVKAALNLAHEVAEIMRDLISKAPGFALGVGKAIVKGIINGIGSVASGIGDAVKGVVGKINPFGDGPGFSVPTGPVGSLMGSSAALKPFAAIGAGFGLHVSSGRRPGAVTSSGNTSYHASGQAIDMAGSPAGMLKTFRALKSRYGPRLAELIYTPGGIGIKDGKPFRYTGAVAADHFDHVHVAFTGGSGDGLGRAASIGDGLGSNAKRIWQFLRGKGYSPAQAAGIIGNFQQESGLNPGAIQPGGPGRGLAQWGGSRFAALQAFAKKRGKPWTDLNTQLQFMVSELSGSERSAGAALKGAHTVADATNIFGKQYERYGIAGDRLAPAQAALRAFQNIKGATSTGGGGASTSGAALAAAKVNPFDQKMASADLAIQQAQTGKASTRTFQKVAAMVAKRKLLGKRIQSIRKALKGKLSASKRLSLTQELTQRLQEHAQLGTDIKDLVHPASTGTTDVGGAAGDTGDGGDPNQALIDSNNALQAKIDEQIQAEKEHTAALGDVQAELKRQTDLATAVQSTEAFQLKKYLADVLSGQIGGYGIVPRSYTPGSGVAHRY